MTIDAGVIGKIAGLVAFASFPVYIASIIRGETRPERATYAIWSFINIVTFFSYVASGAHDTIWVLLAYMLGQLTIFALSFKYGQGGSSRLDIVCLSLAVMAIVLWIMTRNPLSALYLSIFAEFMGLVPTIKKSYLYPNTESKLAWFIGFAGSALNLLAITTFVWHIALYPLYVFLGDFIIVVLLFRPGGNRDTSR